MYLSVLQGCSILVKYGIDTDLKDDNGKKAEAYAVDHSDPRLPFLKKVKKGSAILHSTRKFNKEDLRHGSDHAAALVSDLSQGVVILPISLPLILCEKDFNKQHIL